MKDLPPPLFCRPRKSPKYISDSKQPSISCITNIGASDNRSIPCESRRQSNAQRINDNDESLHGSFTGGHFNYFRESSPFITRHRKLDNHPLFINNNDSESYSEDFRKDELNGVNIGDDQEPSTRQIAMVGPMMRQKGILSSINSSSEEIGDFFKFLDFSIKIYHLTF